MSGTRYAKPGSPLKQERYSSSFKKGLLANLVSKRVSTIAAPGEREPIWYLQWLSWQPGALEQIAHEIKSTPAELSRLCLDPDFTPAPLLKDVAGHRRQWIKNLPTHVQTEIGERVADALDYTGRFGSLTLIDGNARIGKSFEARAWCQRSAGIARYIEVPCSTDEASFFRAICKALGVASGLGWKAVQLRDRIEEVMECRDLVLVLDEAHYCWRFTDSRYGVPNRINWIMTALVNRGIGVALITTPQFAATQKKIERLSGWNSTQFTGRVGHLERLPQRLEKRDLLAVAQSLLPEGCPEIWRALAAYAAVNGHNLQSIDANIKRAQWYAEKDGRAIVSRADMRRVFDEITGTESRTIQLASGARATLAPGIRLGIAAGKILTGDGAPAPALTEVERE